VPTRKIGCEIEPTWSASIASPERILANGVVRQGDPQDAVAVALAELDPRIARENLSLYVSFEPRHAFLRLPPVTETIRSSGIHRVVVGTDDPFLREKGKGMDALRNFGFDVILADGEEARACQLLYQDYAKAMNRFVPTLRLGAELAPAGHAGAYVIDAPKIPLPGQFDARLVDLSSMYRQEKLSSDNHWMVILDAFGGIPLDSPLVKEHAKRMVVCVSSGGQADSRLAQLKKAGLTVLGVPSRESRVDLALALRKLRDQGFLSLFCVDSKDIWAAAIQAGLVDSVLCYVREPFDSTHSLSRLERASIDYMQGGAPPFKLGLERSRWVEATESGFWFEADVVQR
jgi:pyrimidine deaminase RibD-like protein